MRYEEPNTARHRAWPSYGVVGVVVRVDEVLAVEEAVDVEL